MDFPECILHICDEAIFKKVVFIADSMFLTYVAIVTKEYHLIII